MRNFFRKKIVLYLHFLCFLFAPFDKKCYLCSTIHSYNINLKHSIMKKLLALFAAAACAGAAFATDVTSLAPAEWTGATGTLPPNWANATPYTFAERYQGSAVSAGNVLTQNITGVENGVYKVTMALAASFTSGRDFECPYGDGISVGFFNDQEEGLSIIDRTTLAEDGATIVELTTEVTDGTLTYGIKNLSDGGNWFAASLISIVFDPSEDDIIVPTAWVGSTGALAPNWANATPYTFAERYQESEMPAGDVLTQTISNLKNGYYQVSLALAASYTSGRGFECAFGDDLSVGFANETQENLPVVERTTLAEDGATLMKLVAEVTDGNLKYGIKNLVPAGNWFAATCLGVERVENPTAITETKTNSAKVAKVMENGRIYVIKNAQKVNLAGQIIK